MTSKQLEKRESIVHEVLSTEKNFVSKLTQVVAHYLKPLSENADSASPFISRANLRSIFSELTVILGLNQMLLQALEKAVSNASPVSSARIGGVFVKIGSFFRWYHSYISNYDNAFQTLKKLKTNSAAFRTFIQTAESKPELGFADLESLLILPVQRIPQYNMLLADLAKVTTEAHPDYNGTQSAVALLNQIGTYVNEKKREAENIHTVISIGKTLIDFPNLAVPYRRFVRKATLFCLPESAPSTPVMLFAFNDVLLIAHEANEPGRYTVLHYAYWERVSLIAPVDPNSLTPATGENPIGLTVRLKDSILSLVANSPEERKEWALLIREHVDTTKRKTAENQVAQALKKKLLGAANQGHNSHGSHQDSIALRSLGVLAKGMMHSEETSDQHSAPVLSPGRDLTSGGASSVSQSTSSLGNTSLSGLQGSSGSISGGIIGASGAGAGAGGQHSSRPTTIRPGATSFIIQSGTAANSSSAIVNRSLPSASLAALKLRAQEDKMRSKKSRELIESEVKSLLLKEGVKDGSIEDFLTSHNVDAYYIAPIVLLTAKGGQNPGALFAISHCAFFIFVKSKLVHSAFLFDIKEISSRVHPDFTIKMADGTTYDCRSQFCDDVIYQLRRAYLLTYFGIPDSVAWGITTDEWRQPNIIFDDEKKISFGNFVRTYRAACAYLSIPLREDLIWDIMHNPSNSIAPSDQDPYSYAELNFSFVEELTNNDLKTLMLALRYNPFFTSLVIRDVVLSRDGVSAISDMLRFNHTLRRIVLVSNGLAKDHISTLQEAFNTPPACNLRRLEVLEIKNNEIENINFLTKHLDTNRKNIALTELDLSNTGLGPKMLTTLFSSLRKTTPIYHTLTKLVLAGCRFDSESSVTAAAFLATPCAIQHFNVSGTQIRLTQVLEAMTRGCIYLEHLDISSNKWDKRFEPLLIKFVTKTDSMRVLRLNNMSLSAEALARLIEAATSNPYVTKLRLSADENSFGALGASLIAKSMKDMQGIVELSLADNDFGDEGLNAIFQTLITGAQTLKRLILDANFKLKTNKSRATMMRSLIKFACSKNCKLLHLSIAGTPTPQTSELTTQSSFRSVGTSSRSAGAQLRTDLIPLLDCLPRVRISELNISGHRCGPRGIIALGRALQESNHVKRIWWDENGATSESFATLVHAIHANMSLVVCSAPLIDLSAILSQGDPIPNAKILKNIELLATHIAENNARRRAASAVSLIGNATLRSNTHKSLSSSMGQFAENPIATQAPSMTANIGKKKSATVAVGQHSSDANKEKRTKDKHGKQEKEHRHRLKLGSIASKVKLVASNAIHPSGSSESGSKSARGAMEGTGKISSGTRKARGSSGSSTGDLNSARVSKSRGSATNSASSTENSDALTAATTAAPTTSGNKERTGSSGKMRHLRLPSIQGTTTVDVPSPSASATSDSALTTATTSSSPEKSSSKTPRSKSPAGSAESAGASTPPLDLSSNKNENDDYWQVKRELSSGGTKVSPRTADIITGVSPRPSSNAIKTRDDQNDEEGDEDEYITHEVDEDESDDGMESLSDLGDDIGEDEIEVLEDDEEVLELDDKYNSDDDEDYILRRRRTKDQDEDDIIEPPSPVPSPRPAEQSLSPTALALKNIAAANTSTSPRYGRDAEDAILAATTNRSPRVNDTENLKASDPINSTSTGGANTASSSSPRVSPRVSPNDSQPPSPRGVATIADDSLDGLRSPISLRMRPKLSRASSSFMRIVNAAKSLPNDLDGLQLGNDGGNNGNDDEDDSDMEMMGRLEVDSDGDHFSDANDDDIDSDESDSDESGADSSDEEERTDESVRSPSDDSDDSEVLDRPLSARSRGSRPERIEERSREQSSGEDSDDSIDRSAFDTPPTLPKTSHEPKQASSSLSPRGNKSAPLSPRSAGSKSPSPRGDQASRASSTYSAGIFEQAPVQPSMPNHKDGTLSARSEPKSNTNEKDFSSDTDDSLAASSSLPSSPVARKHTKPQKRKKKQK